jgi:dipeptidyl aminopeptidase/acylaminoacyl peptidase
VDFMTMAQGRPQNKGGASSIVGSDPAMASLLSPVTHLDHDTAPMLLMHGHEDKTVPLAQSTEMLERCRKADISRCEMVTIDGAPHAFWNMPQWSAETIEKSARFFHSVLDHVGGAGGQ